MNELGHALSIGWHDDGLTDGQEVHGLTRAEKDYGWMRLTGDTHLDADLTNLDPTDPDSDGDGYWDGWLGVYGVGYSDNVILYREHLQDGDGIEGDEMVSEQAGTHPANLNASTAAATSADVDGDDVEEHSNVHIGELHWEQYDNSEDGDPTNGSVTPSPSIEIEVDYDDDVPPEKREAALEAVENYALYDITVDMRMDDKLTDEDLEAGFWEWDDEKPPTSRDDADEIEEKFHDDGDAIYMLLTTEGGKNKIGSDWDGTGGQASSDGDGYLAHDFGTVVFTKHRMNGAVRATAVHEIAHIMGAGRADDLRVGGLGDEVYSGNNNDDTIERVRLVGNSKKRWSTMAEGYPVPYSLPPINNNYVPFSIEELFTIETNNMFSETHSKANT